MRHVVGFQAAEGIIALAHVIVHDRLQHCV
jgi:hypothetical protein